MIPHREPKAMKGNKRKHGTSASGSNTRGRPASAADSSNARERSGSPTRPLYFYMPDQRFGEFSQWYRSRFTVPVDEIRAVVGRDLQDADDQGGEDPEPSADASAAPDPRVMTFGCAEQFMMYCKAARFGDRETQALVMATDSPKTQKRLGRAVAGFGDESWDEVKSEVVVAGNMAKFGQDASLGRRLLDTGDRLLVEAASRDRVWGIGYNAKTAPHQRKHWGENRLGKALMEVRARLRERVEDQEGVPAAGEKEG